MGPSFDGRVLSRGGVRWTEIREVDPGNVRYRYGCRYVKNFAVSTVTNAH